MIENRYMLEFLHNRGIDSDEDWGSVNDPSHGVLDGTNEFVSVVHDLIENKRQIVVLPDYDMDGIMSAVVSYVGLYELGADVKLFVPDPKDDYGFDSESVDNIICQFPECWAILTCDTGIGCVDGVRHAKELGLTVIVTDHHQERKDDTARPYADVTIDPCGIGSTYEHGGICGAHVVWQCLRSLAEAKHRDKLRQVRMLGTFAGIGTVSDMMPMLWENRKLVSGAVQVCKKIWWDPHGCPIFKWLSETDDVYQYAFRGLWYAGNEFRNMGKPNAIGTDGSTTEDAFGFYLAPTFNSVKRMLGDMRDAYGVFIHDMPSYGEEDKLAPENTTQAMRMHRLYLMNEHRKADVAKAMEGIDNANKTELEPFVYVTEASKGLVGLISARITQESHLPSVVVGLHEDGKYHGSGRSPEWYGMITNVDGKVDGITIAGHEGAFGVTADSLEALQDLTDFLRDDTKRLMPSENELNKVDVTIDMRDGSFDYQELVDFAIELDRVRPFGRGFEPPSVAVIFDTSSASWRAIGMDSRHLKASVNGVSCISWNNGPFIENGVPCGCVRFVGDVGINVFNGNMTPQIIGSVNLV